MVVGSLSHRDRYRNLLLEKLPQGPEGLQSIDACGVSFQGENPFRRGYFLGVNLQCFAMRTITSFLIGLACLSIQGNVPTRAGNCSIRLQLGAVVMLVCLYDTWKRFHSECSIGFTLP